MASDEPVVSPRRAAAAAWFSVLATLIWARLGLGLEGGWTAVLLGVFALVAFSVPLALRRSTRDVGTGLCVGALAGLVVAALVDLAV